MTGFILWAAACALIAALLVAGPLLRKRKDDAPPQYAWAIATGVLVVLAAALLYPLWSNWPWRAPPAADSGSIASLLAATNDHPDEVRAWLDLGQGYLRIAQWPLARRSFQHADRLSHGTSADALNGLGETIVYENDSSQVAEAAALFDRALQLDPHSPQALFYTGVSLLNAGNLELARARFAALRDRCQHGADKGCRGAERWRSDGTSCLAIDPVRAGAGRHRRRRLRAWCSGSRVRAPGSK